MVRSLGYIQMSRPPGTRWCSSAVERAEKFLPGQQLHGYTVKKVVPIPELYLTAVVLNHDKTNAQHLHLAREDSNNVFGVVLRTTPRDDTGVPHVLEHTALCGSERFPVRDPFFKMLNRSLSTFMNAFTASDWTMYPFSTQNQQDYQNLMAVYLDAVFFPRLLETDFRQEGWRLEHGDLQDAKSAISFKGIVFNEMKGVFSNSQNLFAEKSGSLLLPTHTYGVCSGGDPLCIPTLQWQQLKEFQKSHYHPSNARFVTYGDIAMEQHLEMIDRCALSRFSHCDSDTAVPSEPQWTSARFAEMSCPPDPMAAEKSKQTTVAVSYRLGDITDTFETFTLSFLGNLLVMGEKSPFYKSLREANIGSDFAPTLGFDSYRKDTTFSVGLQGIRNEDVEKVTKIIDDTFETVIRDGFDEKQVAALLHEIELEQKHQSAKFGLDLAVAVVPVWIHDGDPTEHMQVNRQVNRFKAALADNPRFLQEKVEQYFKLNQHKLTLVMRPQEDYEEKRQAEEDALLKRTVDGLAEDQRRSVYTDGIALAELQMKKEDLSCLPTLKVSDINRTMEQVATDVIYKDCVSVQLCRQPTNGVTYFSAITDMSALPPDLEPYVPLFCNIVTKMAAGAMDFKELSERIDLTTGGLDVSPHISSHHTDENLYEKGVIFSSYCLDRNVNAMFDLWTEIFLRPDLTDASRLTTLVTMAAAELAASLSDAGHSYVICHSASGLSPARRAAETLTGIAQVDMMKTIAEMTDLAPVIEKMKMLSQHLLSRTSLRCCLNATPESMDVGVDAVERFIGGLTGGTPGGRPAGTTAFYTQDAAFVASPSETHFELPFQVNYVGRSMKTTSYTDPDFAALRILANLMTAKFLHREIREKGGAYGGGAIGRTPGVFTFFSYRDPNSLKTLEAYDMAVEWVNSGAFSQQDIDESKLAVFSQVDMPVPPGSKGLIKFAYDLDDATRQRHRQQLFDVCRDDLIRVSQRYLSTENRFSSVTLLGPQNTQTVDSEKWLVKKYA